MQVPSISPSMRELALIGGGLAALVPALWFTVGPAAALSVGGAGLLATLLRARRSPAPGPARVSLVERRALGSGGELWLLDVDGRTVLVACGRGFAAIRPLPGREGERP